MGSKSPQQLVLALGCAPGDITCLTALPRDIATTYPGKYEIHAATNCKSLWSHNPYIAGVHSSPPNGMMQVILDYGRHIKEADLCKLHFLTAFHRNFQRRTGVAVPALHAKGDLHLSEQQRREYPISGRYWVIVPGHKADFTTKAWSMMRWQQLVDRLGNAGLHMVQCGSKHGNNTNPQLSGVIDLVGETDLRDVLWLVAHAEGVICPITSFMHIAAAFDKPCVCIAGGREHWWWEAYVNVQGIKNFGPYCKPVVRPHRYLHTQGKLDCCKTRGCWKNKVLHTERDKHRSYCKYPTDDSYGQKIPKCLEMITVDHVFEAVMSYYTNGELPPIGDPKNIAVPAKVADISPKLFVPGRLDLTAPISRKTIEVPPPAVLPPTIPEIVAKFKGDRVREQQGPTIGGGDVFDNPIIGGSMTICVLMYGDYPEMHRSCLGNILKTTAKDRRQIRVATNALCTKTRLWLEQLKEEGHIHTLINNTENKKKYPAMRQLFWDPDNPITTKWIVWFDDDTIANRNMNWYPDLAHKIIAEYPKKARMVGDLYFFQLHTSQIAWAASRPWWRGRQLQTKNRQPAPNGTNIWFAAGGFWALETAAMRAAGIPDPDIGNNGGDYMVGLQIWQQGYHTAAWNSGKRQVFTSSVGRRGLSEIHTGLPGWQPGGVSKKG